LTALFLWVPFFGRTVEKITLFRKKNKKHGPSSKIENNEKRVPTSKCKAKGPYRI
jgi:hypothetical protein